MPVNRYPDGGADALKAALVQAFGLPGPASVILGNGSDELIQLITMALARPGAAMVAPEPSFEMYRMNALFAGMRYSGVPLRADFALDADAMEAAIARERPALVYLAYPNNPTGNLFDTAAVERVLRAAPGLVVVDEAYHAFADASFLAAARRISQPARAAHRVEDRHGGAAARVRGGGARMDRRIRQGASAV